MMIHGYGNQVEVKECKRDLEGDAKRLKRRIDAFSAMKDATETFVREGHLHWFDEREHRSAMLVTIAGLGLELPALQSEYERILDAIEKER